MQRCATTFANFANYFRQSIITLPALKEKYLKNFELMAATLREDFEEPEIEKIYKVG